MEFVQADGTPGVVLLAGPVVPQLCVRITSGACCHYGFWASAPSLLSLPFAGIVNRSKMGPFFKNISGDSDDQHGLGINNLTQFSHFGGE